MGAFGMVLMEISSNVPSDSEYFRPACVPGERVSDGFWASESLGLLNPNHILLSADENPLSVGSPAFFHSSGNASLHSKHDGLIKWTDSKVSLITSPLITPLQITKCDDARRLLNMVCATHNSCAGDEGGAIVQKIDQQDTVVGIVIESARDCDKKSNDKAVSTGHYSDKICLLAGICKT